MNLSGKVKVVHGIEAESSSEAVQVGLDRLLGRVPGGVESN
jgi:hypothetical protein